MELVIASHNVQKVFELREMFKEIGLKIELFSLFDFPQYTLKTALSPSFQENAQAKALQAAQDLNKACLADDSGLVIPVLGGLLSTFQRRKEASTPPKNLTQLLLDQLKPYKEIDRSAYLECSLALALPLELKKTFTGRIEGTVIDEEKGKSGFEFDTIFQRHEYSKTMGELPFSVRLKISHRRKALEKIALSIEQTLRPQHES